MVKKRVSGVVHRPHVNLEDNIITIRLPPNMAYVGEALEAVLPSVLHKFAVHASKGDWMTNGSTQESAYEHLLDEVAELKEAIQSNNVQDVLMEAADVINTAMITATLYQNNVAVERREIDWYGRKLVARADGEVEYSDGRRSGEKIKFAVAKKGHYEINLYKTNTAKGYKRTARAVVILTAFKGPKPFPEAECDHINGLKWDDRPENLQWLHKSLNSAQSGRMASHQVHR